MARSAIDGASADCQPRVLVGLMNTNEPGLVVVDSARCKVEPLGTAFGRMAECKQFDRIDFARRGLRQVRSSFVADGLPAVGRLMPAITCGRVENGLSMYRQ